MADQREMSRRFRLGWHLAGLKLRVACAFLGHDWYPREFAFVMGGRQRGRGSGIECRRCGTYQLKSEVWHG